MVPAAHRFKKIKYEQKDSSDLLFIELKKKKALYFSVNHLSKHGNLLLLLEIEWHYPSVSLTDCITSFIGTSRALFAARFLTCTTSRENSFSPAIRATRKPLRSAYVS